MTDPTTEQQRAALEKAALETCWCEGDCEAFRRNDGACELFRRSKRDARKNIATYLAATGREAEAEQVRSAGYG